MTGDNGVAVLPYKVKRIIFDVKNIQWLKFMRFPRPIRKSRVAMLKKALGSGSPMVTPLIVNNVGTGGRDSFRVVDGNHRLTAIRALIEEDPTRKFQVDVEIYDHLNEREELDLFEKVNTVANINPNDRLCNRQGLYPIIQRLQKDFPAPFVIANGAIKEGFRAMTFLVCYLSRYQTAGEFSTMLAKDRFEKGIQALSDGDYESMRTFADDFIKTFGMPGTRNSFSKMTGLTALMQIYFHNLKLGTVTRDEIVTRWEKVILDPQVKTGVGMSGKRATKFVIDQMILAMNQGYHKRLVVSPPLPNQNGT